MSRQLKQPKALKKSRQKPCPKCGNAFVLHTIEKTDATTYWVCPPVRS